MKLKTMKKLEEAIKEVKEELEERINNIDWDKSEGDSWQDKCQQKEEFLDNANDEIFEIEETITRIKESNLIDF